ncbi:MAG: hypothetical protein IH800_16275, partial [Myxococcales bacterium]|nr:hypothetical protein [Myxococcales bacterium]
VDELGEAKASQVPVATGPYEVDVWRVGERMDLRAVEGHWRITPQVEQFTVIELREPLTMVAAFKTGEIDFAPIPNSLLQSTLNDTAGSSKLARELEDRDLRGPERPGSGRHQSELRADLRESPRGHARPLIPSTAAQRASELFRARTRTTCWGTLFSHSNCR